MTERRFRQDFSVMSKYTTRVAQRPTGNLHIIYIILTYLRDSGFMKRRLNQRIVQALGRCNRADED